VFRLGLAVIAVAVSIPVMQANSAIELSIVRGLNPPPAAISWLVTSVFWLGSAGVVTLLVIVGLLVPRFTAVRWTALAAVLTWGLCVLLGALLGPAMERSQITLDDDAFAARVPDMDLGPGLRGALGGGRQRQFRAGLLVHLQREDLAETRGAATAVQHGLAADLQLQTE
jgi:hypothetical protein